MNKDKLKKFTDGLVEKINNKFQQIITLINTVNESISLLTNRLDAINWRTLENVVEKPINYYNKDNVVAGKMFNSSGALVNNSNFSYYITDCRLKRGITYTIAKEVEYADGNTIVFLNDSNNLVSMGTPVEKRVGSFFLLQITIPSDTNITKFGFNIGRVSTSNIIIYEGDGNPTIPSTTPHNTAPIEVAEHTIGIGFDNTGTKLNSTSIQDAIKELSYRTTVTRSYNIGETRTFAYDISNRVSTLNLVSDNTNDTNSLGTTIELDNHIWLKCEGQTIEYNGENIPLPISSEGNYIFVCVGEC